MFTKVSQISFSLLEKAIENLHVKRISKPDYFLWYP